MIQTKIGFMPSDRFQAPWPQKMRGECLAALSKIQGVEKSVPQPSLDGETLDAEKGHTPSGMVGTLEVKTVTHAWHYAGLGT